MKEQILQKLREEFNFSPDEKISCRTALRMIENSVSELVEPLINTDFAKYLDKNYPTLLFEIETAIDSYILDKE